MKRKYTNQIMVVLGCIGLFILTSCHKCNGTSAEARIINNSNQEISLVIKDGSKEIDINELENSVVTDYKKYSAGNITIKLTTSAIDTTYKVLLKACSKYDISLNKDMALTLFSKAYK